MSSRATILQSGYIVDRRQDYIWFVGLPFAICFALLSGHYLPGAALAAIALWITIPHHFVTWLRVHGSPSEFSRFKERFVLSTILLVAFTHALAFHGLTEGLVRDFGFGLVGFNANFDLFSYSLLSSFALLHYYYDAFIWKVRKKEVQEGL